MKVIDHKVPTHKPSLRLPQKIQISSMLPLDDPNERLNGPGRLWMAYLSTSIAFQNRTQDLTNEKETFAFHLGNV